MDSTKATANTSAAPVASAKQYRLGVALSGGGARGFAHAGALMAIEEAGLKPDVLAGVSAGSVIAVMYASGIKPLEMAEIFASTGFRDFAELSFGNGGFMKIDKFKSFVMNVLGDKKSLEDLEIPTYLGATDLDHGEPVAFSTGEIGPRLIASCSIPIVFRPVDIDGVNYVDGGVLRNHPAWIIRDKCETLIGVNVSPLIQTTKKPKSIVEVALRTYNLMAKANQTTDMDLCDVSVETPEIANMAVFDLKNIKKVFLSGYIHTRKALKEAGLWNPKAEPPMLSELSHKRVNKR
ncbi:MAG: patatin-like phospholipase family protein [Muribaculaceae bacterium]|nr:patatin-like phospholipase family protein [Muribaculaceae bacterium]